MAKKSTRTKSKSVARVAKPVASSYDEPVSTAELSARAMLVSLNIRHFNPSITDRNVTAEVHTTHNVKEKAGKYKKNCIDIDNPLWIAVIEAKSNLRNKYYEMTLPWAQDGWRILTMLMFEEFMKKMRELKAEYMSACEAFIDGFPGIKAQAKADLNGMYNEGDYPTSIASKFGCDMERSVLASENDFRVELAQEHVTEIRKEIAAQIQKTAEEAMKDPYRRLYTRICALVDRLTEVTVTDDEGKKRTKCKPFHDSLVSNVQELVENLPGLNLTGDDRLAELGQKTKDVVANLDPEELRRKPEVRKAVRKDAKAIQDIMAAFMGPMLKTEKE